jgi:competence protein ComEA
LWGEGHQKKERRMKNNTKCILAMVLLIVFLAAVAGSPALAQETNKININKATVEELSTLKRIGPSYAQRIVDYRDEHGPFQKPEDIMNVRGIGVKTFEVNKKIITCE